MHHNPQTAAPAPAAALPRSLFSWSAEKYEFALFAVATIAAFAHTVDEMRIGVLSAVPFAVLNLALLAGWPLLGSGWRAWGSIAFGLFWGLTVIPYHVLPLLEGTVTGQNVSGLSRLVAGVAMVGLGATMLRRREVTRSDVPVSSSHIHRLRDRDSE
jgi:hypothetical protein